MLFLSDKDRINLIAIVESVNKIKNFTDGITSSKEFYEDEKTFDSVLMNFIVIGESVAKLSANSRKKPEVISGVSSKPVSDIGLGKPALGYTQI